LASVSERLHQAGGEVIAISVDDDDRTAAMFARWPTPNVLYVSDPGGETYLQAMKMWDPEERGGLALPGLFVIDPDGNETFGYRGNDFADRRHDDDVFEALEALGLDPIEASAGGPVVGDVDVDQKGAFTPKMFGPYFAGNKFGGLAIALRAEGEEAKRLGHEHRQMSDAMLEAWKQVSTRESVTSEATSNGLAAEWNAPPEEIADYYDDWAASGGYDTDVASWGYEAPERVAAMVVERSAPGEVLDAGCGTGRVGVALRAAGVDDIIGGDFTPASIEVARSLGVYRSVGHLDLNGPLDFATDRFSAAVSVGVFSYVADTGAALAELLRVVRPGGTVIFTQRTDLWHERSCDAVIQSFVDSGDCVAHMSEPSPYLPGHPEFGADISIIYSTLEVLK
jgi:predicted TPR repeat methyltransferase